MSAEATQHPNGSARGPFRSLVHRLSGQAALPVEGRLGSFERATGWLGTEPLTPEALRGRVVLVDFWTYTCVNWLRTLPYLRAWHAKYAADGLTVVGVHTPEFSFEHDPGNVAGRIRDLGIEYPVALDNDYGVWDEFANHYWPALYLADAEGRIRFHHFGEGEYAMTEMAIQQLLAESGHDVDLELAAVDPRGLELGAEWATLRSPETYLGYGQSSGFASSGAEVYDGRDEYEPDGRLALNTWDLSGDWTMTREAVVLNAARGRIRFAFHARDVNLILGPASSGTPVPFRVTLDDRAVGDARGVDLDAEGGGIVTRQDTLQLIRQRGEIADHVVGVEFLEPGVEAFCFTFG